MYYCCYRGCRSKISSIHFGQRQPFTCRQFLFPVPRCWRTDTYDTTPHAYLTHTITINNTVTHSRKTLQRWISTRFQLTAKVSCIFSYNDRLIFIMLQRQQEENLRYKNQRRPRLEESRAFRCLLPAYFCRKPNKSNTTRTPSAGRTLYHTNFCLGF